MIKRLSIFIVLLTIVCMHMSCSNEDKILTLPELSQVLLDLHLAEAYAQHLPKDSVQRDLKNVDSLNVWDASILKKHHVTEKRFSVSMEWYKNHPELLDSAYQKMLSELTIMATKLDK